MKVLLASLAHNSHVQNIAQALHETGVLGMFRSGAVDNYRSRCGRALRRRLGSSLPALDRRLSRRRITTVPDEFISADRSWDTLRSLVHVARLGENIKDRIWETSEFRFDEACARLLATERFDAYFGVEHGALRSLETARRLGKAALIAFLSPHHQTLADWVFSEYERFPELITPYVRQLLQLAPRRNHRKDKEARLADAIHTASRFTAESLITHAGVDPRRIVIAPLGGPAPIAELELGPLPGPTRFIYSGPLSVRKGAHYLLEAWKALHRTSHASLDLYGRLELPAACMQNLGEQVRIHGPVSEPEILAAYRRSSVLVFPTLCDGFGLVVQEALAHGVPVITTTNAGAADLIEHGRNGFIVPPRDPQALALQMEWCITHPLELEGMRKAALETARQWTWQKYRATLQAGLGRVLGWELPNSAPVSAAYMASC